MSDMTPPEDAPPVQEHAQRARREAVANLPRPSQGVSGMDTAAIRDEVRRVREIDSTVRLYVREWICDSKHDTEEEATAYAHAKYDGRLLPEDVRYDPVPSGTALMTRIWNVRAEFNSRERCDAYNAATPDLGEHEIVDRNSRREHELREYGIRKLIGPVTKKASPPTSLPADAE